MEMRDIEKAVDEMLQPYDIVIDRKDLAKILDCTYVYVPQKVKDMKIPIMSDTGSLKVAKPILKQYLVRQFAGSINDVSANEENSNN